MEYKKKKNSKRQKIEMKNNQKPEKDKKWKKKNQMVDKKRFTLYF